MEAPTAMAVVLLGGAAGAPVGWGLSEALVAAGVGRASEGTGEELGLAVTSVDTKTVAASVVVATADEDAVDVLVDDSVVVVLGAVHTSQVMV